MAWATLATMALGFLTSPACGQYYGPGLAGSPSSNAGPFMGRPGALSFGNNPPPRQPGFCPGGNKGFNPGFPFANGFWGSGNPYLNYYNGIGYASPFYASPGFYGADYYAPPPVNYATPPPAQDDQRLPPPTRLPAPDPRVAYIDLHVPADASVWAQGVKMDTKGTLRRFITPALEGGSFSYEFRIVYQDNGKDVNLVRHISVAAGDRKSLTILDPVATK